jgi:CheY-like chemotaxis protein/anti-sigma regulatory factor (Ser/Thr protein kinase)
VTNDAANVGREVELLSHDIRSAVSDVIGGLRLIETQNLDASLRTQIGGVQAASEVLARLIEDALVHVSGEKQQPLLASNLHLRRLLRDMERRWTMRGNLQGVTFTLDVSADVPDVIQLDRLALERVLANLIGNAVKYSGESNVRLNVLLASEKTLCFCVIDEGPGFSDAALARLFSANARPAEGALAGSGLGLHISKQNADILGANLTITNRPEGGAKAVLEVPYEGWHGGSPHGGAAPDLSAYRILVADDNDTNQLLLSQMLATMGAECELASDGIEALNWMGRERFDLALIDIEMPRLGGLDVLRAARNRQKAGINPRMPLIAMTAYVLRDNRDAIYAAGADGLLAKPLVSIESFGHALLHYIAAHSSVPLVSPIQIKAGPNAAPYDVETLTNLLQIAGTEGAVELMDRLQADLTTVARGLRAAQVTGSLPDIRSHTHVLISLSSAVGAGRVHQRSQALNTAARQGNAEAVARDTPDLLVALKRLRDALKAGPPAKDAQ